MIDFAFVVHVTSSFENQEDRLKKKEKTAYKNSTKIKNDNNEEKMSNDQCKYKPLRILQYHLLLILFVLEVVITCWDCICFRDMDTNNSNYK